MSNLNLGLLITSIGSLALVVAELVRSGAPWPAAATAVTGTLAALFADADGDGTPNLFDDTPEGGEGEQ